MIKRRVRHAGSIRVGHPFSIHHRLLVPAFTGSATLELVAAAGCVLLPALRTARLAGRG